VEHGLVERGVVSEVSEGIHSIGVASRDVDVTFRDVEVVGVVEVDRGLAFQVEVWACLVVEEVHLTFQVAEGAFLVDGAFRVVEAFQVVEGAFLEQVVLVVGALLVVEGAVVASGRGVTGACLVADQMVEEVAYVGFQERRGLQEVVRLYLTLP